MYSNWLTRQEAADCLGVTVLTLDAYRKRKLLVAKKVLNRVYFDRQSVYRLMDIDNAPDEFEHDTKN